MLATLETVKELLPKTKGLVLAGAESMLGAVPPGAWIGGTIPYFMTADGGKETDDRIFVVEVPAFSVGARIVVYDEQSIARIGLDSPENGYTILILPAFARLHQQFAMDSPRYEQQFMKVIAGWIAGSHLKDIGRATPRVFAGPDGERLDNHGVAIHVELPPAYEATLGIVNIFEPGPGPVLQFLENGFEVGECLVDGKRENVIDFLERTRWDVRLPLTAEFCGATLNVSVSAADHQRRRLRLFAPVFEGVAYRVAKPVDNYAERFAAAVPSAAGHSVFACNCVLNYPHGRLEGRRAGALLGPMTFGEIAYQVLNQTLVHIAVAKRA